VATCTSMFIECTAEILAVTITMSENFETTLEFVKKSQVTWKWFKLAYWVSAYLHWQRPEPLQ